MPIKIEYGVCIGLVICILVMALICGHKHHKSQQVSAAAPTVAPYNCAVGGCRNGGRCMAVPSGKTIIHTCSCPRGYGGAACDKL